MELLERRVYRGPSLYAHFPVMRLTIDLGVLESWPSAKIPGFNDGLLAAIPSLRAHTCSFESEGGFVRRLQEDGGTWLGHVLEHTAIELQNVAGAASPSARRAPPTSRVSTTWCSSTSRRKSAWRRDAWPWHCSTRCSRRSYARPTRCRPASISPQRATA